MESLLAELDGEVLEAGGNGKGSAIGVGLSGGEYLATLKQAKNGQAGSQAGGGKQQGGGSKDRSDMLQDLRTLQGNRRAGSVKTEEALLAPGMTGLPGQFTLAGMNAPAEVTGHVVQGAMAKERLSSESLQGIGSQIQSLKNGGGEIRVRLKPDNLGELHLRVSTHGNQVALQIQASDERSKQILEESVSHLKESLAAQSLSLGRVDFTVAQSFGANLGGDSAQQQQGQQQQQNQFGGLLNQQDGGQKNGGNWNDGGGLGRREAPRDLPNVNAMPLRPRGMNPGLASSGRLDVMA
jgi:flagellar hook-length control protein FliK